MKYLVIISLFFLLFSCKKESQEPVVNKIDYSYFPLDTGKYILYEVSEIEIDSALNYYDTVRYQIKSVFESYFTDAEGNKAVRIERYKRNNPSQNWTIADVWQANIANNSAQKVEENIRYVKMVFPVSLNKEWNGNAFNTMDEETYSISNLNQAYSVNGLEFDSVMTITQFYDSTLLYKYYKSEKYAKNVGMIYKIDMNIESQNITFPNVPVENRITSGTIYIQKILEYGIEQ